MNQTFEDLFYGSILHDVGKVVQRATSQRVKHSKIGHDFLKDLNFNQAVLDQVAYHHAQELSTSHLDNDNLAYITYLADNIASGIDRRDNTESNDGRVFNPELPLEDIFNRFGKFTSKRTYHAQSLDINAGPNYADTDEKLFSSSQYGEIIERIRVNLEIIEPNQSYMSSTLNLLEATLAYIPSSTNLTEVADISLYDHVKITTAIAMSIYQYLSASNRTNYKQELFNQSEGFYNEDAFLLASFDLSGVQDFIYTIVSQGAHKQLRSRSFYLDMLSEWLADVILQKLSLSRANLLYTGGGHAYLILANTEETKNVLSEVEDSFNRFFIEKFGTKLYVAIGSTEFAAKEVMKGNTPEEYQSIFRQVSKEISNKKISRYSAETIQQLNQFGKKQGRECKVCHTIHNLLDDDDKCIVCQGLENFSRDIQDEDYFLIGSNPTDLQIGPGAYLSTITKKEILQQDNEGIFYAKNGQLTGKNQAVHIWVADYSKAPNNEFSYYTDRAWAANDQGQIEGIKRLGVVRADVDDLGFGFMAGYSGQSNGNYNTLSRTASFSRNMSLFFKFFINQIAEEFAVSIIYSGGDDVFAIGAWDDVIEFTVALREEFLYLTNEKLTLSAGIGMYHEKTPINILARQTGELEEAAKNSGKDAICLFDPSNTFGFDEFIDDIRDQYLFAIDEFFSSQTEKGKAFMYRLLQLIEERNETDKISFARLAYTLARMEEESQKNYGQTNEEFNNFKEVLEEAFKDATEIKKFDMALRLYIYITRKDG